MSLLLIFHLILDNSYTCVTIKYSLRIKNQSLKDQAENPDTYIFFNFGIS